MSTVDAWVGYAAAAIHHQHGIRRGMAEEASAKEADLRIALAKHRREVSRLEAELAIAQEQSREAWQREEEAFVGWQARTLEERDAAARDRAARWSLEPAREPSR